MKKQLVAVVVVLVFFCAGLLLGMRIENKRTIAALDIENRSGHTIMTAIVSHEKGSAIAANIKKGRSQRVRFFSQGPNNYTIRVTFDDNRTIYAQERRVIKNGELLREVVADTAITSERR